MKPAGRDQSQDRKINLHCLNKQNKIDSVMKITLKYKIISLITVFSALSVILILVIAIQAFKKDKTAFIFETSLNTSHFLAEQLQIEIQNKSNLVKSYLKLFFSNQNNPSYEIEDADPVDEIQIYQKKDELKEVFSAHKKNKEKTNISSDADFKEIVQKTGQIQDLKNGIIIRGCALYVYEYIFKNGNYFFIFYSYKSQVLEKIFNQKNYFKSALVNISGEVKSQNFGLSKDILLKNFTEFDANINTQLGKLLNTSVFTLKSANGENWLFTSSQIGYFDLFFISAVSEKAVFGFFEILYFKSTILFCLLISFVFLTGIFITHFTIQRLQNLTVAAKKVSTGDFNVEISTQGHDEVGLLSKAFSEMIHRIDILLSEVAGKARMEAELKTAQIVQSTLFPQNAAIMGGLHINGFFKSASECGGDWWHYSEDEKYVWVWIADATGHGVSAALLTSACKSAVHLIQKQKCEPVEAMGLLNSAIFDVADGQMMMTCFLSRFDKSTRILEYVNASHEVPLRIPKQSNITSEKFNFLFSSEHKNKRLGQQKDSSYVSSEIQLNKGDRLFFYTDGFFELKASLAEPFKERHLLKLLVNSYNEGKDFSGAVHFFKSSLEPYLQNKYLEDDLTYIFIEVEENV